MHAWSLERDVLGTAPVIAFGIRAPRHVRTSPDRQHLFRFQVHPSRETLRRPAYCRSRQPSSPAPPVTFTDQPPFPQRRHLGRAPKRSAAATLERRELPRLGSVAAPSSSPPGQLDGPPHS